MEASLHYIVKACSKQLSTFIICSVSSCRIICYVICMLHIIYCYKCGIFLFLFYMGLYLAKLTGYIPSNPSTWKVEAGVLEVQGHP